MSAWNDLITQAFINLAVIQVGETITSAMQTDAQTRLNQLLSSLSTEGLTAFNQVSQSFNPSSGVVAYTLGSAVNSASLVTTGNLRALKLTAWRAAYAGVLTSGGRVLSLEEFGAASAQSQTTGEATPIPRIVGADTSYPLINVRISPPPGTLVGVLELDYYTPITQITNFAATVALPEGWEHMLHANLAVALAPQYARQGGISQEVAALAQNSKQALISQNQMSGAPPAQAA